MTVSVVLEAGDIVGESLTYDDRRDALVWVDIGGKRIHRLWLADRRHEIWPAPEFPTSIGLRADGGAIVGLTTRVALWEFGGDFVTLAIPEPTVAGNRLNEGMVAPDGSFWVGTMQNNVAPDGSALPMDRSSGAIHRVDPSGRVTTLTEAIYGISNTMAWTDDGGFLFADTLKDEIYRFDLVDGALINRRLFTGGIGRGVPDGSTLDAAGGLWNCRVAGGAAVARFTREGALDRLVDMPCTWPTSCAFGGADLDTLYVASARFTMTPDHIAANPLEGGLFAVTGLAKGRPTHRFG